MKTQGHNLKLAIAAVVASMMLTACAPLSAPEGSANVRNKLTRLQADQDLASRAPVAIKEAEMAVRAAEVPEKDKKLAQHRVYIADQKVDIAAARAQGRLYEDQRVGLAKASESARLASRTREADMAHMDANIARDDAASARDDADAARDAAEVTRLQNEALKRELAELNARETDRGIVLTLGDVLFATGRAELNGGAISNLAKLAAFFNQYPDRTAAIEGHTDNVGSESANFSLSQRRADAVRNYLANQGIAANRMTSAGMGEGVPVAGNDTDTGRQQNRRVEVIIVNPS
ncbi:MAG: OmpA family protein [Porticoccaceae bacterium]|nr:OmpA family protein [Porticoccaceae bacterium]